MEVPCLSKICCRTFVSLCLKKCVCLWILKIYWSCTHSLISLDNSIDLSIFTNVYFLKKRPEEKNYCNLGSIFIFFLYKKTRKQKQFWCGIYLILFIRKKLLSPYHSPKTFDPFKQRAQMGSRFNLAIISNLLSWNNA